MQAMNNATAPQNSRRLLASPDRAHAWIAAMLKPLLSRLSTAQALAPKKMMAVPTSSPTSPTRTVKNALSAARLLASSSHQWPMSMNDVRPMISHPRMSCTMFSDMSMMSMPPEKSVMDAKKCV